MKKLMTSTIIILPLLILAIMLVSGAIKSLVTHIYVESVEFSQSKTLVLVMDDEDNPPSYELAPEINVLPLKASNRALTYTVDDESIATVDENGVISAGYYGETYVTVTSAENKAAFAKRKIVVTDTSVHDIEIDEVRNAEMYEGETQRLTVTVYPKEADKKLVSWSSSDENILRVSNNGTVTAVGEGVATITATSDENGGITDSVQIKCHKKIEDISFDATPVITSLDTEKFPAVAHYPEDAFVTLEYKSDNDSIAAVNEKGEITFKKQGHVTITVTATDFGGKQIKRSKEYTSTIGYYFPPLFENSQYTVDYDTYADGSPLPIPFAPRLQDADKEFISALYSINNVETDDVLQFDEVQKVFRFIGPMPEGSSLLRVVVEAKVYDSGKGKLAIYSDQFMLTVLRNASGIKVNYNGTDDAGTIIISRDKLAFGTGEAKVDVTPANHTNAIVYELSDGSDVAQITSAGALTFSREGSATVHILCKAGENTTAEKSVRVIYAPAGAHDKKAELAPVTAENKSIVLSNKDGADKEQGVIYLAEPYGATVSCAAGKGEEIVKLGNTDGVYRIIPVKGGFDTVKITVNPESGAAIEYTVDVYVDSPVSASDLSVTLDGKPYAESYGTSGERISYNLGAAAANGAMEGKRLYISYGVSAKAYGADGAAAFDGTIEFVDGSTLSVTFGVEYTSDALDYGADNGGLSEAVKTVKISRDAKEIKVSYNGTDDVATITTTSARLTFADKITVLPANYTGGIEYRLENNADGNASIAGGELTFANEGEVTVVIEVRSAAGDKEVVATKKVDVQYTVPEQDDVIVNVTESENHKIALNMPRSDKAANGIINFTAPADSDIDYKVEGESGVIELRDNSRIIPKKGGFATVKITVTPQAGGGAENKEYTIDVFVNVPVKYTVELGGKNASTVYTGGTEVAFNVKAETADGGMAGKKLYVSYDGVKTYGGDDGATYGGTINFAAEKSTLNVTFGAQYTDAVKEYGVVSEADADDYRAQTVRTVMRNATGVEVTYDGVQTEKIIISQKTLTFTTESGNSGKGYAFVKATPANHTNKTVKYVLSENKESAASITVQGVLTFTKAGAVKVKAQYLSDDNAVAAEKEITVIYVEAAANEKQIFGGTASASQTEQKIALNKKDSGVDDKGLIMFTEPENMQVDYEIADEVSGGEVVDLQQTDGVWRIIPLKGGFATVKITVTPLSGISARGASEYTVEIYVDSPVRESDFTVLLNDKNVQSLRTSKDSISYSVAVKDNNGSMAGKKIYVSYENEKSEGADGSAAFDGNGEVIDFRKTAKNSLNVTFGVEYTRKAADFVAAGGLSSVAREVSTSNGLLDNVTINYAGGALDKNQANALAFGDLGEEIALTIADGFTPEDFAIAQGNVQFEGVGLAGVDTRTDGNTLTLTSKAPCEDSDLKLTVGGITFNLKITVRVKADKVEVSYGGGDALSGEREYFTLLDSLDFKVSVSEDNGNAVTNRSVKYSIDGGTQWTEVSPAQGRYDAVATVSIKDMTSDKIIFASSDGNASTEIFISQTDLGSYSLELSAARSGGDSETMSAKSGGTFTMPLPSDMLGDITLKVTPDEDYLGGFGSDNAWFGLILPVEIADNTDGWSVSHEAADGEIIIKCNGNTFRRQVVLGKEPVKTRIEFTLMNLKGISFGGLDSGNTEDIYKGYQQVRVFAKHSDYGDGNGKVDYYRVAVNAYDDVQLSNAIKDFSLFTWKLTGYKGQDSQGVITEQSGDTVKYKGTEYKIVKVGDGYELQTAGGDAVVGADGIYKEGMPKVSWVDVYTEAEEGYARLYFGDFGGLSEVDVQNDYFGDFGERGESWKKVADLGTEYGEKEKSGRSFKASENAYTFMRVQAGDGSEKGINCHFNFNVLADDTLVNVFNATGYYAHSNLVLHENLYGVGELGTEGAKYNEANEKGLFLENTAAWNTMDTNVLGKAIVYGNGYQVNLQAKNEALKTAEPQKKNNSWGVRFGNMYNLYVKGANQESDGVINYLRQKIVLQFTMAYYCDLQLYTKGRPVDGKTAYLKNTVLHAASQSGFQLYYTNENAYIENVTIVECAAGLTNEKTLTDDEISGTNGKDKHVTHYYFKGNFDVLNFVNLRGVAAMAGSALSEQTLGLLSVVAGDTVGPYMEWFGRKLAAQYAEELLFFNLTIYTSNRNCSYNYWDGEKYVENNTSVAVNGNEHMNSILDITSMFGTDVKKQLGGAEVTAWTYYYPRNVDLWLPGNSYAYKVTVDGRQPKFSGLSTQYYDKMFTDEKYIRLLCQYLDCEDDGGNELVKNEEHILWHMQQAYRDVTLIPKRNNNHIEALKDSITGKNIVWRDGTTPEIAIEEYNAANEIASNMNKLLSQTTPPDKKQYA